MNSERVGNADYLQSGGYTIVLMVYNDKLEMVDTVTIMNRRPTNSLILEMTAKTTDELGSRRLFRVFDATSYTEGMDTLSLMITVNSEAKRRIMIFRDDKTHISSTRQDSIDAVATTNSERTRNHY